MIQERMLRFCEACNGCSFYFLASLIKNLLVETVVSSYYLKLSLPMFLKCFLIFAYFQSRVSYRHVSHKKTCICNEVIHCDLLKTGFLSKKGSLIIFEGMSHRTPPVCPYIQRTEIKNK